MKSQIVFQQLFEKETSTYTYLLGCGETLEAVLIDPVLTAIERDLQLVNDLGLKLKFVLDTHIHADHVTAAGELRLRLGLKTGVSHAAKVACADLALRDGDVFEIGTLKLRALATPGHTDSCMCFHVGDRVFTGDTLLIRGCGRTDFQQGSAGALYDSVHQKLFTLEEGTIVYPGHDYRGFTSSTIGVEKRLNPRLGSGRLRTDFVQLMNDLKLPHPKQISEALPLNMGCGLRS